MKYLARTGVGTADHAESILDTDGTGILPVQAGVTGTATFRLLGRVSADAPWIEIRSAATADYLESISWVPYIRLDVTAGTGTVQVWIGEK